MRFWTLPYDRHLTEWLKAVDPSRPSIMVAREFGGQPRQWQFGRADLLARNWLESLDLAWQPDPRLNPQDPNAYPTATGPGWIAAKRAAFNSILGEIEQLQMLMQDDRDRYMAEIIEQADGSAGYITSFIDTSESRRPWTMELVNCGYAIGNVAYFYYKQQFRRVRPSTLCPGLAPPFGPPAHPSFTSGHSFIGHFVALLLLEIPALRQRYGMFVAPYDGKPGQVVDPYPAVTISLANPAVVTLSVLTAHGLNAGDPITFQPIPGGQPLPAPLASGTTYYVLAAGLTANSFEIAATLNGAPIGTGGGGPLAPPPPVPALIPSANPLMGRGELTSPLLWLGERLAKNRERLGVHYASDSAGSRHIAAGIWRALLHDTTTSRINCPTLSSVLAHATAEWPTKWP
ncbi:hypothetical protein [Bradyrhizobium sp. BR 10261]|uniref:hypothetical protein n=1 Tax=Bradyrhizobium sp. BR 10261 TaxID=2749992 RepID=UPI001C651B6C|nr:hypothetical protein [Bradyrhizobium sp. BR 10261]MBW7961015.1 hypothetical protein [Bradyrhizobium sp. BR 10261]